jgi:hypothetical protein
MKKVFVILLIFVCLGSLSFILGCGGGTESQKTPSKTEQKTESSTDSGGTMKKTGDATIDPAVQELQDMSDNGRMTWRSTDPVVVTRETVIDGLNYTLISNDSVSKAQVDVEYADKIIHVYLYKPIRQDPTGIWVIEKSDETPK